MVLKFELARKWFIFSCSILFEVTLAFYFGKMCLTKSNITESKIQNLFVDYRDMNILEMAPQN